jgi:hypothetical protein
MRRLSLLALLLPFLPTAAPADQSFVPAPADKVPGYYAEPMPCHVYQAPTRVECKGGLLEKKSLRELAILRNTIFSRYGWDGYKKPWLRDHFHAQPWFKPNPKFNYKMLSEADRKNAHFIGSKEQSFQEFQLAEMRDTIYGKHGRKWGDKIPDNAFSADEKIELGLLSRAMGGFALEDQQSSDDSLDRLLKPAEVRALSLRDLRLLRNSIYARRGRPFKSQILRDHFSGMSWYKVNAGYSDKLLSKNDARNIALIKSVENEFGGPLTDDDWLIEPATDGA